MNTLDWKLEQDRFTRVAHRRTLDAARHAFRKWHSRKRDDAVAECVGKTWDAWSRLLLRGRNPEPLLSGLIRFSILWVRYDRRIAGRGRRPDVFDYRAGLKRQQLSVQGQASPTDRGDARNGFIEWRTDTGDDPAGLASALEGTGLTSGEWFDT
jgi:hypothetical protein